MATITQAEAEALLTARGWTFDDVALSAVGSSKARRDPAVDLGRKLGVDSGTAAQLLEVAKRTPPGT